MGIANPYVNNNGVADKQGPVAPSQNFGRLQLYARANINSPDPVEYQNGPLNDIGQPDGTDGKIAGLMSESPVFAITPPSNFTLRILLEGYHKGLDTGIVGQPGTEGTGFENNALRIRFYTNEGNAPGTLVPNTTTLNKDNYSADSRNPENRGKGKYNFADIPFTLADAIPGDYFVVVDNLNYLPIMSAFAANFKYEGNGEDVRTLTSG